MLTGVQIKEGVELLQPPKFQILPESQSQNNYGTTIISISIVINCNFLLKYKKFTKILAEINAQITGKGLCRVQNFKISSSNILLRVSTMTGIHNYRSWSLNRGHLKIFFYLCPCLLNNSPCSWKISSEHLPLKCCAQNVMFG